MGYDITFHPVALAELQHFVFDVIDNPRLLDERIEELSDDPGTQEAIGELFRLTLRAIERDASADAEADEDSPDAADDEDDVGPADEAVRNLAASVAGCLHPYWYSRGGALSFARDSSFSALVHPYSEIAQGRVRTIEDADGPYITGNGSATGFIKPESVVALARRLDAGDPVLLAGLGESGADSLKRALAYAVERGLGLIEAADLTIPGGGLFSTDPKSLRAFHLGDLDAPPPRRIHKRRARSKPSEVISCWWGFGLLVATLAGAIAAHRLGAGTDRIVGIVIVGGAWGIGALMRSIE